MISELRILDLVFFVESVNKAMSGDAFFNVTIKWCKSRASMDYTISHQLT